jgi:pectate lyase
MIVVNPFWFDTPGPPTGATATDTFDRADSNPLSNPASDGISTWATGEGVAGNISIVGNVAKRGSGTLAVARITSPVFAADQVSEVVAGATSLGSSPAVRIQAGSASCYYLRAINAATLRIYKATDTGSLSEVDIASVGGLVMGAGSVFKLEALTNTIRGYLDGAVVLSVSDSSWPTGQPGVACRNSSSECDSFQGDDWTP